MDALDKAGDDQFVVGDIIRVRRRGKRGIFNADYADEGKHCRRSLETRNRREAEKRAYRLLEKIQVGAVAHDTIDEVDLAEGTKLYMSHVRGEGRAPKTIMKYGAEIDRLTRFAAARGVCSPAQITPRLYDEYRLHLVEAHSLESYTVHILAVIAKQWLAYLVSRRAIASNPLKEFRIREPRRRRYPAATLHQVLAIRNRIVSQLRSIITVLAFTGMRLGEGVLLHAEHVDFSQHVIRLFPIGALRLKTEAAQREISMHPVVEQILRDVLGGRRSGLVFQTSAGKSINPRSVNDKFMEAAASLGIKVGRSNIGLTVHSLRRFFKTCCYDHGVPKPLVDQWAGHADDDMDAHYYSTTKAQDWMRRLPFGDVVVDDDNGGGNVRNCEDGPAR